MEQNGSESSNNAVVAVEGGILVSKQRRASFKGIKIQNPSTFKVGQVFTAFGVGCGVGIGVGRPINMGAIPVVNQVMGATRGATDAFSSVMGHVNNVQFMTRVMFKFRMGPNLPIGPGALPGSLQSSMSMMSGPLLQSRIGSMMQLGTSLDNTSQMVPGYGNMGSSPFQNFASSSSTDLSVQNRTKKVVSSFMQNAALKQEGYTKLNDLVGSLRSENNMLQMVLTHQRILKELREDSKKLREILIQDLKVPPGKISGSHSIKHKSPCTDCFECRRKQRRK